MYIVNKFIYYINRNYKIIFCVVVDGYNGMFCNNNKIYLVELGLNSSGQEYFVLVLDGWVNESGKWQFCYYGSMIVVLMVCGVI